jgi:signal transduction histidine kinase
VPGRHARDAHVDRREAGAPRCRRPAGSTIQIFLTGRRDRARYTLEVPGAFQVTLEQLPGPACFLGEGGRIAAHNPAFEAWAGRADVEGLPLVALLPGDPVVARLWDDARRGPVDHHVHRRARSATGASLWSLHAAPAGPGVLVSACDITAFAQAAQAMHTAHRDYVAMGVHELRAPLAAIKAWAGALGTHPSEPLAEGLAAIGRKVDQMDELITDLLEVARSDAAAVRPRREAIAVDALVRAALAASPSGARAAIEGALPGRARVDATHVEVALGKVLAFVARRRAEGPIAVTAVEAGREVHVLVADTGQPEPGLADPFGRASRFGRGRSAGLGLYLAQQLLTANGGRVWREPDGDGARFVVALPTADEAGREPRADAFAQVLLVEPDPRRRARTAAVMRLAGHDVTATGDLGAFEAGRHDAVIVDVAARGEAEIADAAVILVGAGAAGLPPGSAERAGAIAVLPEPLDIPRLVALVAGVAAARCG